MIIFGIVCLLISIVLILLQLGLRKIQREFSASIRELECLLKNIGDWKERFLIQESEGPIMDKDLKERIERYQHYNFYTPPYQYFLRDTDSNDNPS